MSNYITIPLSKKGKHAGKYQATVDIADADLADLNWSYTKTPTNNVAYSYRSIRKNGKKYTIHMHRVILARKLECDELLPTEFVDHINGNGLDNRRENLRLATHQQNLANQKLAKHNTSGYKGVSWNWRAKKWVARIQVNRKNLYLGSFDTPEQAHEAYCKKAIELYGEFANFGQASITVESEGELT